MDKIINTLKQFFFRAKAVIFDTREGAAISPFKAVVGTLLLTGLFILILPLIMLIFMVQMGLILVGMLAVLFMGTRQSPFQWHHEEKLVNPEPDRGEPSTSN